MSFADIDYDARAREYAGEDYDLALVIARKTWDLHADDERSKSDYAEVPEWDHLHDSTQFHRITDASHIARAVRQAGYRLVEEARS